MLRSSRAIPALLSLIGLLLLSAAASTSHAVPLYVIDFEGTVELGDFGGNPDFQDLRSPAFGFTVTQPGFYTFDVLARDNADVDVIGSSATQQVIDVALTVFDANGDLVGRDFGSPEFFGDGGVDGIESPNDADPFVTFQLDPGFYTAVLQNTLGATASILDDDLLTLDFRETLGGSDDDDFGFLIDRTTGLPIPGTSAEVRLAIGVVEPNPGGPLVRGVVVVPEPGTLTLVMAGMLALAGWRSPRGPSLCRDPRRRRRPPA